MRRPNATVIDAGGKFVMPGIIDSHSHIALDDDVNEPTSPITPHMMMNDAFDYNDKAIYRALAGGVTTSLLLHGSANMIGGQAVVIKHKYGARARRHALSRRAAVHQVRQRRESEARIRQRKTSCLPRAWATLRCSARRFVEAQEYMRTWDDYDAKVKKGDKDATPPKKDLKLEALADVLRGKLMVQIHCYRADEFLTEMAMAKEFGYKIRAFHHALEAYKVAGQDRRQRRGHCHLGRTGGATSRKPGTAIPWNAVISMRKGVRVAHQERLGRRDPPPEPGSRQDACTTAADRRRSAEDDHAEPGVDHRRGRPRGLD